MVTFKPAHIGSRAPTAIRVHLVSTSLCALHQIWLIDLRRFPRHDPKPAVYARLVLLRAEWPSPSTGARAQKPANKQTKAAAFTAKRRHADTHRVLGEMLVDGLVLQVVVIQMVFSHAHSSNMASPRPDRSLQINRRTEPRRAVRKR